MEFEPDIGHGLCPRCGSNDPRGIRMECDIHSHKFHDAADRIREDIAELERLSTLAPEATQEKK
jgi:hypothetical protein